MNHDEQDDDDQPSYRTGYAKDNKWCCKRCQQFIKTGAFQIGKLVQVNLFISIKKLINFILKSLYMIEVAKI